MPIYVLCLEISLALYTLRLFKTSTAAITIQISCTNECKPLESIGIVPLCVTHPEYNWLDTQIAQLALQVVSFPNTHILIY